MTTSPNQKTSINQTSNFNKSIYQEIKIEIFERRIFLKLPKNEKDIAFIRSITYSKWDSTWFHWVLPNYPGNLDLIKTYFNGRINSIIEHQDEKINLPSIEEPILKKRNEVILIKSASNRLRIIFGFNKELMFAIKKIAYHSWDAKNKWWSIPYSVHFQELIQSKINELGLSYSYIEEVVTNNAVQRVSPLEIPNYKFTPENFILKLRELRYSQNTEKTYKGATDSYRYGRLPKFQPFQRYR